SSAEELVRELDRRARPDAPVAESPYRGLRPFDAADRALFFGRQAEIAAMIDRLRGEPWLVVAGRSGAGKSSLVRAGPAPAIAGGALGERGRWEVATVVPGRRPPTDLLRLLEARRDEGLLVVVDQLEELATIAAPGKRDAFLEALGRLAVLTPGRRVLMT